MPAAAPRSHLQLRDAAGVRAKELDMPNVFPARAKAPPAWFAEARNRGTASFSWERPLDPCAPVGVFRVPLDWTDKQIAQALPFLRCIAPFNVTGGGRVWTRRGAGGRRLKITQSHAIELAQRFDDALRATRARSYAVDDWLALFQDYLDAESTRHNAEPLWRKDLRPAVDGGRLELSTLDRVRRRPAPPRSPRAP
jgi:hypothetical protein